MARQMMTGLSAESLQPSVSLAALYTAMGILRFVFGTKSWTDASACVEEVCFSEEL